MSEVMKLPLILGAISTIGGGVKEIKPVFREAVSKPFGNVWISLAYTFNNLLYFDALSSISAVTYQARAPQPTRRLTMAGPGGSTAAHHGSPRLTTAHNGSPLRAIVCGRCSRNRRPSSPRDSCAS